MQREDVRHPVEVPGVTKDGRQDVEEVVVFVDLSLRRGDEQSRGPVALGRCVLVGLWRNVHQEFRSTCDLSGPSLKFRSIGPVRVCLIWS